MMMTVRCSNRIIADNVRNADTFFARFKGLMGRKSLGIGEGLLLINCPSIHCFFMKMTIDAIYLSKDMTVLGVEKLRPWQLGKRVKNTSHVLELASAPSWLTEGDTVNISEK
jgi:uncharacterized membrane protein (UPF0127 family)